MCTAITYKTKDFYFGRNLDVEQGYGEKVCITPRSYPFVFRNGRTMKEHYSIIGMAVIESGYPLYFDATNEKGLSMAGLNFPDNAVYYPEDCKKENIAPFELIPFVLGSCASADEALYKLKKINLCSDSFSKVLPHTPLHWIIADKNRSVTIEPMIDGLKIYENTLGVLTNNPPFDYHMHNIVNYINLTPNPPENRFCSAVELKPCSLGMGGIGLPGDLSSASRFVRAAFVKLNSVCDETENSSVGSFFQILGSVEQQRGLNRLGGDKYEYTLYSSCCNAEKGIYYYTTCGNRRITAVDMYKTDLNGSGLTAYPLVTEQDVFCQN
ncbi:MAG: choloylglycine hydrolase [Clostridia bacterium]|nr:choloylglycine hydrolase [Clostridia bacterium]